MSVREPTASQAQGLGGGHRSQPAVRTPEIRETTIVSYGGKTVRTLVASPVNRDEVRGAFAYAAERGFAVTFRSGGHAFDTQSLNPKLVISLEKLRRIDIDARAGTVTAEAGARWGDILARSATAGLVPYVMVTTHTASAGGTLSSNSLSRFSPTLGREGQHVLRFSLMTPDGTVHECSRTDNPGLFHAVIGGLGYVGAVLDVTQRLLPLPIAPRNIAVATTFTKVAGLEAIAKALVRHIRGKAPGKASRVVATRRGSEKRRYDSLQGFDNIRQLIRSAQQLQPDTLRQQSVRPLESGTMTEQNLSTHDLLPADSSAKSKKNNYHKK